MPVLSLADTDPVLAGAGREVEERVVEELIVRQRRADPFTHTRLDNRSLPAAATLAEQFAAQPGVTIVGQGGLLQGVSVRGFSRQRLQWRIEDVPIRTERRAGSTLSFLPSALVDGLRIYTPAESQGLGSGAMGGALEAAVASPSRWRVDAVQDTVGWRRELAAQGSLGGWGFGLAEQRQGGAEDATGTRLNTGFAQRAGIVRHRRQVGEVQVDFLTLAAHAEAVGKSNNDYPARSTVYPDDRHVLSQLSVTGANWRGFAYRYRHQLRTAVRDEANTTALSNGSEDFGAGLAWRQSGAQWHTRWFAQWHARRDVEAIENRVRVLNGSEYQALAGGGATRQLGRVEFDAQLAWHGWRQQGHTDDLLTGAVALTQPVSRGEIVFEASRNFRAPTLSERFFTGTTGRGQTVGNPGLKPERIDSLTLRYTQRYGRADLALETFAARARDLVERIDTMPGISTFENVSAAQLAGLRWRVEVDMGSGWQVDLGGDHVYARATDGTPLNNQAGTSAFVQAAYTNGSHTVSAGVQQRLAHRDVSPQDQVLDASTRLDLGWRWQASRALDVSLLVTNALDDAARLATDAKATIGFGRGARVGLRYWPGGR